ncbi:hypothetical protein MMPV_003651 [Pyropia vietnamensis]
MDVPAATAAAAPSTAPAASPATASAAPPLPPTDLYDLLGVADRDAATASTIRAAYLAAARAAHPDTLAAAADADGVPTAAAADMADVAAAYAVLSDPDLRAVYDTAGADGVAAVRSMAARAAALGGGGGDDRAVTRDGGPSGEELDYLSESGDLGASFFLSGAPDGGADGDASAGGEDAPDACPRSVEEAVATIGDSGAPASHRYYALWWVYRFKVTPAVPAVRGVLVNPAAPDRLRRRAALALGAMAPPEAETLSALTGCLASPDYFLRYRAAEALAGVAARGLRRPSGAGVTAAPALPADATAAAAAAADTLGRALVAAAAVQTRVASAASGYARQESLFDLSALEPDVRSRLEAIFAARRAGEDRSRRTTMTPNLDAGVVGGGREDQPVEWLAKAYGHLAAGGVVGGSRAGGGDVDGNGAADVVGALETLATSKTPLVKYAACKALYQLTGVDSWLEPLVAGLGYGVEHHYSQRVLVRDLGEVGAVSAAGAIAGCGMVEASFKILALRSLGGGRGWDVTDAGVRDVLRYMDGLL